MGLTIYTILLRTDTCKDIGTGTGSETAIEGDMAHSESYNIHIRNLHNRNEANPQGQQW